MKSLMVGICLITTYPKAMAQAINATSNNSCVKCNNIILYRYNDTSYINSLESGIIFRKTRIETSIEIDDSVYVFGFGRQNTRVPRMSFDCTKNQDGKTFNGIVNGKKVGIWLKLHPIFGPKKAIMYDSGQVIRVVIFRRNNRIKEVVNYQNGLKKSGVIFTMIRMDM